MARRLEITLSDEQWDRLNVTRGHEPRASFVKRALESALSEGPSRVTRASSVGVAPSASSRAPTGALSVEEAVEALNEGRASRASVLPLDSAPLGGSDADQADVVLPAPSRPAFKCPVARCEFRAKSAAAKCGMHGRTVVPA